MPLPDRQIEAILKKFGPAIIEYLKSVGYFDVEGPYEPSDMFDQRAMREYLSASKAKNAEVWGVVEKYLIPEMQDKGKQFIQIYGLKKPISVKDVADKYVEQRGGELIKKMTRTDQKKLTNYIWLNSSKNERPLARQILKEPHLGYLVSGHRAATIIRTERGRASRSGAQSIAEKAGYTYRIRHEVGDSRTRPSHRRMMGEEAAAGEPYSNGEMYPGSNDINCRGWEEFKFDAKVASNPSPSMETLEELYGDVTTGQKAKVAATSKAPEFVPSMNRSEATDWAKNSIYKDDLFHVTSDEAARSITSNGFDLSNRKFGRVWGDGVYLSTDAPGDYYAKELIRAGKRAETLNLKVNVKKLYEYDASEISLESGQFGSGVPHIVESLGAEDRFNALVKQYRSDGAKIFKEMEEKYPALPYSMKYDKSGEFSEEWVKRVDERKGYLKKTGFTENEEATAIKTLLQENGYDGLLIKDKEFRPAIGGSQLVVFDPKNVVVIK